ICTRNSIEFEFVLVVKLERGILLLFLEHAVANDQSLYFAPHEATERVLGRADDGLASHVETGIDQHRAASALLERFEQRMKPRVGLTVDCLDARRIVDV